jgi:hypothetical protein
MAARTRPGRGKCARQSRSRAFREQRRASPPKAQDAARKAALTGPSRRAAGGHLSQPLTRQQRGHDEYAARIPVTRCDLPSNGRRTCWPAQCPGPPASPPARPDRGAGRPEAFPNWPRLSQIRMLCAHRPPPTTRYSADRNRRYMGDRRSPSPSGHITLDIRVILASFFGPICGDDHPYITRSVAIPGHRAPPPCSPCVGGAHPPDSRLCADRGQLSS